MSGAGDERLAEIRQAIVKYDLVDEPEAFYATDVFLLRLLDEARADADNASAYVSSLKRAVAELCDAIGIERGATDWPVWIETVRAEIARLSAPAGGDLMTQDWLRRLLSWSRARLKERYVAVLDEKLAAGPTPAPNDEPKIIKSASSLGGDLVEQAREIADLYFPPLSPGHDRLARAIATFATTVQREAREAAIGECAASHAALPGNPALRAKEAEAIRSLSGTAPQSGWQDAVVRFTEAILHGDEAHQQWLRDAARAFVTGRPIRALPSPPTEDATG